MKGTLSTGKKPTKQTKKQKRKDKDAGCLLWLYIKLDFQYFTNKLKVKPC